VVGGGEGAGKEGDAKESEKQFQKRRAKITE